MTDLDLRLYAVTDPELVPADRLVDTCLAAVRGGVTIVQLRDKQADDEALLAQAVELRDALAAHGVPLVVNDRVEVAAAAGVGVHVGVRDAPPTEARRRLGASAIVGWSVEDLGQLSNAGELEACSYLAASPIWTTPTKADTAPPLGPDGVAGIRAHCDLPLVGIGGINSRNRAAAVVAAGADGVAVVSAVFGADDPRAAARALRAAVDSALAERSALA